MRAAFAGFNAARNVLSLSSVYVFRQLFDF